MYIEDVYSVALHGYGITGVNFTRFRSVLSFNLLWCSKVPHQRLTMTDFFYDTLQKKDSERGMSIAGRAIKKT